jgi:hypothetical protein
MSVSVVVVVVVVERQWDNRDATLQEPNSLPKGQKWVWPQKSKVLPD